MSDELTPITRKETFLAKAGGQNVVTPTPITREETFLQAIIDNGSGGGGGGGVLIVGVDMSTMTLNKTWQEIYDAPIAVIKIAMDEDSNAFSYIGSVSLSGEDYYAVDAYSFEENGLQRVPFITSSANGYPVMNMG